MLPDLPILTAIPELKNVLKDGSAVLTAPPGSGKTTLAPLALLQEHWLDNKKIIILEPRRLAARAAANRMAHLLGEKIGDTVGYHIRFERKITKSTRIQVLTEGVLTRRIQGDPELSDIGLIIFDEFHERSLHADLALALCLDLCQIRDDLRLLVMSATLDTTPVAELLGNVPVINSPGEMYNVTTEYLSRSPSGRISAVTSAGIKRLISTHTGDILVFLPGAREIQEVQNNLEQDFSFKNILIAPLYGNLSRTEQDKALFPDKSGRRRVILATSIAETSLTIEGVTAVVDSGWSRLPRFERRYGLTRLSTVRVSKAVAKQRTGRAGRLGPGHCLRLWSKNDHFSLPEFHAPEIVTADMAPLALELAQWGVQHPHELQWLDPPRPELYDKGITLLQTCGALSGNGKITTKGTQLASLPIHPRLGHILLYANKINQAQLGCDLCAILSERGMFRADGAQSTNLDDHFSLLSVWREKGKKNAERAGGRLSVCKRVDQSSKQFMRLLHGTKTAWDLNLLGPLLVSAFPERVGQRRKGQEGEYLLSSGRAAMLPTADPLSSSEYIVAPQLHIGKTDARIFLASPVDHSDLKSIPQHLLQERQSVYWSNENKKVISKNEISLDAIVIEKRPVQDIAPEMVLRCLLSGIVEMGIECLPWTKESKQFQARITFLNSVEHDALPNMTSFNLLDDLSWLTPYLDGFSSAKDLKSLSLAAILKSTLSWQQQKKLERYTPPNLTVPSGSKIPIDYTNSPPILAVRIQELFGLTSHPTICCGQTKLLLHLLSPANRPIQVTSDLEGFWYGSYPEVKKELKGRYPKHYWPDNPVTATATRTTKRFMKPNLSPKKSIS